MTTETEDLTMDRLARVYIKMRDKLAQLTREYEEAEAAIKAQQAEISAAMKDIIQTTGAKSISTSHGTVLVICKYDFIPPRWWVTSNNF
jgi:major membrane immunogen (membrane-anchored lipoprotein)